jgi:hydrogenase nickel incorporation protein HypA/HybF
MHELQVTHGILDTVLRSARDANARRVVRIRLRIGELSDVRQEWLQRYFDYLSSGTIAEGAEILVRRIPVGFDCRDCNSQFDMDLKSTDRVRCPVCGGTNCTLERGREFLVDEMEAEV